MILNSASVVGMHIVKLLYLRLGQRSRYAIADTPLHTESYA
jgi:hypothetical protein